MVYDPAIHHRRSIRLKGWDYRRPGWYFITIVTQDRICAFGDVINGKMVLNKFGEIVQSEWLKTAEIRPNVFLDEFVVMPNHFHGILVITRDAKSNRAGAIGPIAPARGPIAPTHGPNVSADGQMMFANGPITHASETAGNGISSTNRSGRPRLLSNSLGAIVGQFKSVTTKRIRKSGFDSL